MKLGTVTVDVLNDGFWRSDGGAMFGVVPRVMWERKLAPDDRNRVAMALRCLLIRDAGTTILVDTGLGDKLSPRELDAFGVDRDRGIIGQLADRGLGPESIDIVVNTHLHLDHAGGNTTRRGEYLAPTFPNAEYWVQQREWTDALNPNERTRSTYLSENLLPIETSGQLRIHDGPIQITPAIRWTISPGHTPAHTCVIVESAGASALFAVDVCPFVAHLERIAWVPAVDVEPLVSMETKRSLIADVLTHDRLVIFDHDPNVVTARLSGSTDRWQVNVVELQFHPIG